MIRALADRSFGLAAVEERPSGISVPGARALILAESVAANDSAFMVGREFAHIHPEPHGGSMHLRLDPREAQEVIDKGWGENHFLVDAGRLAPGIVMVYAPRDERDLDVIWKIVVRSYEFAKGSR